MKLINIKSAIFFGLSVILGAMPAVSQQRTLPAAHNAQHTDLIAHQRSVAKEMNAAFIKRQADAIAEREEREEIFSSNWDNNNLNPYASLEVPATKNINVAEGVVPVPGNLSSPYGWRARFGRMHRGVDLTLRVGDTVRVAFSGKVRMCKYEGKGYGYYVVVRHDNGLETVYGHLSRFLCKPNQRVKAGDPIALGGNTGRSTGPHLHFETRFMGLPFNPEGIFDFTHKTTHKDVYTFDKDSYKRSQVTGPRHGSRHNLASAKKSSKKSSGKKRRSRRR